MPYDAEQFSAFFPAVFTLLQVWTGDSWCSNVARPIILHEGLIGAVFFISFVFVNSIVMSNAVVAVLVDRFLDTVKSQETEEAQNAPKESLCEMPQDPLMSAPLEEVFGKVQDSILGEVAEVRAKLRRVKALAERAALDLELRKDGRSTQRMVFPFDTPEAAYPGAADAKASVPQPVPQPVPQQMKLLLPPPLPPSCLNPEDAPDTDTDSLQCDVCSRENSEWISTRASSLGPHIES